MSSNSADVDVVVVGGGIGGLSNAVALTQAGLKVRVLEQAPEFGEVGAGLQIAPNCTRILADWGLLDEVLSLGVTPENLIMRDAIDGSELTRLDLRDTRERYGSPYVVIHRSDLHGTLLREAKRLGVDLVTSARVTGVEHRGRGAAALSPGRRDSAEVVIAADGLRSVIRPLFSADEPVSSAYVAYRGAVPTESVHALGISLHDVVVYVGPRCHFVQYPLRQGEMFNQVAVFESPKARAGEQDWGTPDELEGAFAKTCENVRSGLPHMWRDPLVADVRPRPDRQLGAGPRRPDRRCRPPAASVPRSGGGHGDGGRLGPRRTREAAGPQGIPGPRLGGRARRLQRRPSHPLPPCCHHRPQVG